MAERQIGHRRSRLVLSARFPVVNLISSRSVVLLLNQPNLMNVMQWNFSKITLFVGALTVFTGFSASCPFLGMVLLVIYKC